MLIKAYTYFNAIYKHVHERQIDLGPSCINADKWLIIVFSLTFKVEILEVDLMWTKYIPRVMNVEGETCTMASVPLGELFNNRIGLLLDLYTCILTLSCWFYPCIFFIFQLKMQDVHLHGPSMTRIMHMDVKDNTPMFFWVS